MNFYTKKLDDIKHSVVDSLQVPTVSSLLTNGLYHETFQKLASNFRGRASGITGLVSVLSVLSDLLLSDTETIIPWFPAETEEDQLIKDAILELCHIINDEYSGGLTITLSDGNIVTITGEISQITHPSDPEHPQDVVTIKCNNHMIIGYTTSYQMYYFPNWIALNGDTIRVDDILMDLSVNSELLDYYTTVCDTLATDISVTKVSGISNGKWKFTEVTNAAKDVVGTISTTGPAGLVMYFKDMYNSLAGMTPSATNDSIEFTDNSSLVPEHYTVGIFSAIAQTAGAIISVALTVINPVLGLIAGAITAGVSVATKAISSYTSSAVLATINGKGNVCMVPFSTNKGSVPTYLFPSLPDAISASISSGVPMISKFFSTNCFSWVTNQNQDMVFNYETHLDTADRIPELYNLLKGKILAQEHDDDPSIQNQSRRFTMYFIANTSVPAQYRIDWSRLFHCNGAGGKSLDNEPDTGCLSSDSDAALRSIVAMNLFFLIICSTEAWKNGYHSTVDGLYFDCSKVSWDRSPDVYFMNGVSMAVDTHQLNNWSAAQKISSFLSRIFNKLTSESQATLADMYNLDFSWAELIAVQDMIDTRVSFISDNMTLVVGGLTSQSLPLFSALQGSYIMPSTIEYPIIIPKYRRDTFWLSVALVSAITVVTAVAVIGTSIYVKKRLRQWSMHRSANLEQMWDQCKNNPTDENIKAFDKARKKNNKISSIFGGTKYGVGYWDVLSDSPASIQNSESKDQLSEVITLIRGV